MAEQSGDRPPAVEGPTRTRLWQRTAGAAAVVAVLVVGNATAASGSERSDVATTSGHTLSDPAASTPASAVLHGEFKVINRDGSAQVRRWQSGTVDAIDEIPMTVRSADGFDSAYLLGPGVSITGIGLGDEVTIVGAGPAVGTNS